MDILIETATSNEVHRWGDGPGKVNIPGTGDVVFPGDSPRPIDIGPDHFLATETVVDEDIGNGQKRGPEVVSVVGTSASDDQSSTVSGKAIACTFNNTPANATMSLCAWDAA